MNIFWETEFSQKILVCFQFLCFDPVIANTIVVSLHAYISLTPWKLHDVQNQFLCYILPVHLVRLKLFVPNEGSHVENKSFPPLLQSSVYNMISFNVEVDG